MDGVGLLWLIRRDLWGVVGTDSRGAVRRERRISWRMSCVNIDLEMALIGARSNQLIVRCHRRGVFLARQEQQRKKGDLPKYFNIDFFFIRY